jgi:EKC/KEOPS complex subunit CGI121/TPRKB
MQSPHVLELPHLTDYSVCVLLFKDVQYAAFLRQQLLAGNSEFEYAFLDATNV